MTTVMPPRMGGAVPRAPNGNISCSASGGVTSRGQPALGAAHNEPSSRKSGREERPLPGVLSPIYFATLCRSRSYGHSTHRRSSTSQEAQLHTSSNHRAPQACSAVTTTSPIDRLHSCSCPKVRRQAVPRRRRPELRAAGGLRSRFGARVVTYGRGTPSPG